MKMKHVMAALLFGVVAVGAAQAQEMQYKYYTITPKVYGSTTTINAKNTNQAHQMGLHSYSQSWTKPILQTGDGKYKAPRNSHIGNGILNRGVANVFNARSAAYISGQEWLGNPYKILVWSPFLEGGRFLWPDKDVCVVEGSFRAKPDEKTCDLSKHPEGLPNSCAKPGEEFPPNPSLCDDPRTGRIRNEEGEPIDQGGVACDNTGRYNCFWATKGFNEEVKNKTARQIVRTCALEHEETHRKSSLNICKPGQRTGSEIDRDGISRKGLKGEAIGYEAELACLERDAKLCGNDNDCVKELIERMSLADKIIKELNESLEKAGPAPL